MTQIERYYPWSKWIPCNCPTPANPMFCSSTYHGCIPHPHPITSCSEVFEHLHQHHTTPGGSRHRFPTFSECPSCTYPQKRSTKGNFSWLKCMIFESWNLVEQLAAQLGQHMMQHVSLFGDKHSFHGVPIQAASRVKEPDDFTGILNTSKIPEENIEGQQQVFGRYV